MVKAFLMAKWSKLSSWQNGQWFQTGHKEIIKKKKSLASVATSNDNRCSKPPSHGTTQALHKVSEEYVLLLAMGPSQFLDISRLGLILT